MSLFCEVCSVEVQSEITMRDHLKGKKHIRLSMLLDKHRKQAESSIFVKGFRKGTKEEDLQSYFSQFGIMDSFYLDKERSLFAIVQFTDRYVTQRVLSSQHFLKDQKLTVKPKEIKHFQPRKSHHLPLKTSKQPAIPSIYHEDLVKNLNACGSLEDQMHSLQRLVELPEEDVSLRALIQKQLQDIFSPYIPGCEINQFGSSVNGFGIKGCDMDIFLDMNLDVPVKEEGGRPCGRLQLPYTGDVKTIVVVNGVITRQSLLAADLQDRVKLVSRILSNSGDLFSNIIAIPGARCPVIKCEHRATGMKCDLSINNRLALRNTRLIKLFSSLDPRVRPLLYSLRYWAKKKEIAGNLNSGPRLTNYSLTLLMVYYLQSLPVPVLPTIEQMSTIAGEKVIVDGWSCEYETDPSRLPPSENKQTLTELFQGFFHVFSKFDFSNNVISARHGNTQHITKFKDSADKEKLAYFKISPVCIQDPFVLEHNTTANVNEKTKFKIILEFTQAVHKMKKEQFTSLTPDSNWGLSYLLDEETVDLDPRDLSIHQSSLAANSPEGSYSSPFSFSIEMQSAKLSATFLDSFSSLPQMKDAWCQKTYLFICKLLKDILYFDIASVDAENANQSNNDQSSNQSSNDILLGNATMQTADKGVLDIGEKHVSSDRDKAGDPCETQIKCVGEKSVVEEPMSEMYLDDNQTRNGKRHPSGGSENEAQDRKRHKLDDEGRQELTEGESGKCTVAPSSDCTTEVGKTVPQDAASPKSNIPCLDDSQTNLVCDLPEIEPPHDQGSDVRPEGEDHQDGTLSKTMIAHVKCSSQQRVWINRRKYQKEVRQTEELGYNMELKVSQLMLKNNSSEQEIGVLHSMTFDLIFEKNIDHTNTNVLLNFYPPSTAKEFACFYLFLKSFILKLVDKCSPETFEA